MKKSNQSSNKTLRTNSIKRIFTVPMILCIILFTFSFFYSVFLDTYYSIYESEWDTLISMLKSEAYALSRYAQSYSPSYYLSAAYSDTTVTFFFGLIAAILQFNFLLSKKSCYTQLSFAVGRRQLFFNKVFYPVIITAGITIIIKLMAAAVNIYYLGLHKNLFIGLFVNILSSFVPFLISYTIVIIAHLFTARKAEAYLLILSIMNFPSAISLVIDNILAHTLYGYESMSGIFGYIGLVSDIAVIDESDTSDCFAVYGKISLLPELLAAIIGLVIVCVALIGCKHYFVNRFKAEHCGTKGKSRVALVISCLVLPLSFVHYFGFFNDYLYEEAFAFPLLFIIGLIVTAILTIIICLLVTWSPKKIACGATSAGIAIVLQLIVMIIGFTGGFGYATRIPDIKDVEYVNISTPFDMSHANTENEFFLPGLSYDSVVLTGEDELQIAQTIHQTIVDDRAEETGAYCEITYVLKNGTTIYRSYKNISSSALAEYMNVWESKQLKTRLGVMLNQIDSKEWVKATETDPLAIPDSVNIDSVYVEDYYDYPTVIPLFTDSFIISKDYKTTPFSSFYNSDTFSNEYKNFTKELMGAIYKDACVLSAKEWFEPEKELGAIAFEYNSDFYSEPNTLNMYGYIFYINTNMTNTIKVLDKYDYTKYFATDKKVEKAHLVDVNEAAQWLQADYSDIFGKQEMHLSYFAQNNTYISSYLADCCEYYNYGLESDGYDWYEDDYDDWYDEEYDYGPLDLSDIPLPHQEEITDLNLAQKMVDDAFMAYNVGNEGKFLVVKYTDGSCSMLVVPDKNK